MPKKAKVGAVSGKAAAKVKSTSGDSGNSAVNL
jgi:hypothetical protein